MRNKCTHEDINDKIRLKVFEDITQSIAHESYIAQNRAVLNKEKKEARIIKKNNNNKSLNNFSRKREIWKCLKEDKISKK